MYKQIVLAAVATTMATSAFAQAGTGSHNPAVKSPAPRSTATPAAGRNSFTEAQARDRIAKAGYASVSKLAKNENGVWQGTAKKGRAKVHVALDYKGNVTTH